MDDLKHKLLGFINKQGPKIPSMGFSDETYHPVATETLSVNSKTIPESDRPADQDILESIQDAYFLGNDNYDISRFELDKLPESLNCDSIERDFKALKQQHQVVSKKVLQLILEQQSACNAEFENIVQIQNQLNETVTVCRDGRQELNEAKEQFVTSLSILANYRKRQLVQNLLHSLNAIKSLHSTEGRLQELLNEENYPGAITLLLECQAAAITYRHFHCVAALTNKLKETLVLAEEQLDQALAKICLEFDEPAYTKLQAAYRLLGKTQTAMDQLLMHYTSAIYNTAFSIVRSYAILTDTQDGGTGKKQYKELCTLVPKHDFLTCLMELCKSLFAIMLSYYHLVAWYNNNNSEEEHIIPEGQSDNLEENFDKQYIKKKIESGLGRVWHDVQSKVSVYLVNADLTWYKFEQFVQVLSIVHRLMEVGEEFCGSKSEELQDSIRKQSFNYFKNYHTSRLEELKIFLENEIWEICPVKSNFDILQLQEFKSLRSVLKNFKGRPQSAQSVTTGVNSPDCNSSNHSQDGSSISGNYFNRFSYSGTPFDSKLDETLYEEDFLANGMDEASGYCSDDSEDESEELKKDFVDEYADENNSITKISKEKKEKHNFKSPILTNTTLTVLRQMGKYLQMSRLLRPIAFDIICCMNQLFDFYLYAVHSFFASDLSVSSNSLYSIRLHSTLTRIADTLIDDCNPMNDQVSITRDRVSKPHLSEIVDLTQRETLNGLTERLVAVESLIFLSKQYESLQCYLEHLVTSPNKKMLQQFYSQTISIVHELRRPVYMAVIAQAFDLRQILMHMSKVNWEVKDVMSQHSAYIDMLLREIQIFTMRMEDVALKVPVSKDIYNSLWENIAHIITHTLVEGFAFAKKCSNGGRGLMQLDFTQLQSKFEKLSGLRPMPHKEYVESYVKAYYLTESELEKWIRTHNEYSSKHMFSLVNCACQNNKKLKQRLLTVIEEMEKTGIR